jgi:hypothetical protein
VDRKRVYVVLAVVVVAIASIVVLLFTGEAQPVRQFEDASGDALVEEGDNPPTDLTLADVRSAEVREEDGEIVFEAQLGGPIPDRLRDGAFGLRWEVYEGGDSTFLVTANLDVGPNASIFAEQGNFGGSTIDETFPGSLEVVDDRISIRLDPGEVEGFPSEFAWLLKTSLDGDQGDAQSARAEDRAPDQGFGEYPADS